MLIFWWYFLDCNLALHYSRALSSEFSEILDFERVEFWLGVLAVCRAAFVDRMAQVMRVSVVRIFAGRGGRLFEGNVDACSYFFWTHTMTFNHSNRWMSSDGLCFRMWPIFKIELCWIFWTGGRMMMIDSVIYFDCFA